MDLLKTKKESLDIYKKLCSSQSTYLKCLEMECAGISACFHNALAVLFPNDFIIITGSKGEGTDIISLDYGRTFNSSTLCYVSDKDMMRVLCDFPVIDEGDALPQRFDNHMYLRAERGKHTTDGFRKLKVIHSPHYYSSKQYRADNWADTINLSLEKGYMSSSTFLAITLMRPFYFPMKTPIKDGLGSQGPSQIIEENGSPSDVVRCFYVKTWPNEAESWFTRKTHWPDMELKSKIRKIGYLLVPIGNSNSEESDLEWRCSFSIAEKILFQSLTNIQRCTFVMLKVLLKEYLPSDINTDGEKQLLSTYHIKTLFLWCLEDSQVKWQPEHILRNIGHTLDKLLRWIHRQYFPHYFIPSVNLLDSRRLHGREKSLSCFISNLNNNLNNTMKQSQFFTGQAMSFASNGMINHELIFKCIHHYVMHTIKGTLQTVMHLKVHEEMDIVRELNFSHSMLIEGVISMEPVIHPRIQHLYRAVQSDLVHAELLMKTLPQLIDQYRGCMHMAKYCMAARDGQVLPEELNTAESLLNDTLHVDPCSGYVKLACLYIATGDLVQATNILHAAENNFLLIHKYMWTCAMKNVQINRVDLDKSHTELLTVTIREIFQEWADGQVTSDIVMTWPEYITVPDLLQFELIHESTQKVIHSTYKNGNGPDEIYGLDCFLQCPPLSLINLLKFVCAFNSGGSSSSHMENLVADLVANALSVPVYPGGNDLYTVFNMAAWCYLKIKQYKPATRMMMVAFGTSPETDIINRCAFSHHFLAYIIEQCLASCQRKQSPGLQ